MKRRHVYEADLSENDRRELVEHERIRDAFTAAFGALESETSKLRKMAIGPA